VSDESSSDRAFVVGGEGPLGFALPMAEVVRVVSADALPPRHRRLSLARLFGAPAERPATRYAEMKDAGVDTYFELGEAADVRHVAADAIEAVPLCLFTTARRWAWAGIFRDGAAYRVVVDVAALAPLAAERGAS